jgi:hypothetical protein
MLSPRQVEFLYAEGYMRVTDTAHEPGMKMVTHSCGNVCPLEQ